MNEKQRIYQHEESFEPPDRSIADACGCWWLLAFVVTCAVFPLVFDESFLLVPGKKQVEAKRDLESRQ
jgi:hypothetical protein